MSLIDAPNRGIYDDVPMNEYNQMDCARSGHLAAMAKGDQPTPAHVRLGQMKAGINGATASTGIGAGVHLALFEPKLYQSSVEIWTDTKTRGAAFKKRQAELGEGGLLLTSDEAAKVAPMIAQIHGKPKIRKMLEACQSREMTIVFDISPWGQPEIKLRCRARMDGWAPSLNAVIDLKTTESASREKFKRSVWQYGYAYQAAVYRAAALDHGLEWSHHIWIAAENVEPYGVAAYRCPDKWIDEADEKMSEPIRMLAAAYASGDWSDYPDALTDLEEEAP